MAEAKSEKVVVYRGPTEDGDLSTEFVIDGVRLSLDRPLKVSAAVAKELLSGSDRVSGHDFEEVTGKDAEAAQTADEAEEAAAATGGPVGDEPEGQ